MVDFIETKGRKYNRLNIRGESEMFKLKVNTTKSKAKVTYKATKAQHNKEIKAQRTAIKASHKAIKQHRILKKQAKNVYRLSKIMQ